jgi:hypothetical protein
MAQGWLPLRRFALDGLMTPLLLCLLVTSAERRGRAAACSCRTADAVRSSGRRECAAKRERRERERRREGGTARRQAAHGGYSETPWRAQKRLEPARKSPKGGIHAAMGIAAEYLSVCGGTYTPQWILRRK